MFASFYIRCLVSMSVKYHIGINTLKQFIQILSGWLTNDSCKAFSIIGKAIMLKMNLDFCTLKTEHSNSYQWLFLASNRQAVATPNLPVLRVEQRVRAMQLPGAE